MAGYAYTSTAAGGQVATKARQFLLAMKYNDDVRCNNVLLLLQQRFSMDRRAVLQAITRIAYP